MIDAYYNSRFYHALLDTWVKSTSIRRPSDHQCTNMKTKIGSVPFKTATSGKFAKEELVSGSSSIGSVSLKESRHWETSHQGRGKVGGCDLPEDTRPDWFRVLQTIRSGPARAELLRAHLTPPSENYFFEVKRHSEEKPEPPLACAEKTNSSPASTGISRTFVPPEKNLEVRQEAPVSPAFDDDEDAESLAEMLVRTRPGGGLASISFFRYFSIFDASSGRGKTGVKLISVRSATLDTVSVLQQ